MDHKEENQENLQPEQESKLLLAVSFFLAWIIILPLRTLLRVIESIGVLSVGLSAGLLIFSIMGLYSSGLGSILMWGLLIVSIAIPVLYYKIQIDSDAISDAQTEVMAEKIYGYSKRKIGIGRPNDQDHA